MSASNGGTYVCTLSPELMKKAKDELNEKPEWRGKDIQALRDMVKAHPGLHCPMTDEFLLRFLRARKFDYDRAYQLILQYYTVRDENKKLFEDLTPSAAGRVVDDCVCIVLPKKDKLGRYILFLRPGKWDTSSYPIYRIALSEVMNLELIMQQNEDAQVNGIVLLGDMSGVGMAHAKAFERGYAKLVTSILQDAFPMRMKGMRILHEPPIFGYIFSLIKPFLKEKLQKRLVLYGEDLDRLKEEFGEECLPEELGGTLGPVEALEKEWVAKLKANEEMFEKMKGNYLDIPKQIMKGTTGETVQGLVGAYRKLNVD